LRFLQTITIFDDFVAFCERLEKHELWTLSFPITTISVISLYGHEFDRLFLFPQNQLRRYRSMKYTIMLKLL
jgi:hypothetical protein